MNIKYNDKLLTPSDGRTASLWFGGVFTEAESTLRFSKRAKKTRYRKGRCSCALSFQSKQVGEVMLATDCVNTTNAALFYLFPLLKLLKMHLWYFLYTKMRLKGGHTRILST